MRLARYFARACPSHSAVISRQVSRHDAQRRFDLYEPRHTCHLFERLRHVADSFLGSTLILLGFYRLDLPPGQWIESVTDWAICNTYCFLFADWSSSHARLADPIRPMPNKGKSRHSGLPIALISRLPDWVVQSVLPIAIHRLLHRFYPLASWSEIAKP